MTAIASAADLVKLHEGLRLKAYDDSNAQPIRPGILIKGHPTIGYGRALDVDGITPQEAELLLANDLEIAAHQAAGSVGDDIWPSLTPARQAAFTDMCLNMGSLRFASFHQMIAAARKGDWQGVHDQALKSAWSVQVGARAQMDAAMLLTGEWPA